LLLILYKYRNYLYIFNVQCIKNQFGVNYSSHVSPNKPLSEEDYDKREGDLITGLKVGVTPLSS
jgi:hypothetical protein